MNTAKNFNTILLQLNERDVFEVVILLTLFRMWGQKAPPPSPTSFSSATSANVRINAQNILSLSFNPIATLTSNFKFVPSASPNLLTLNQDHPSKKAVFLVKPL